MRSVRDYIIITAAYWAFTLTDGALRMLVLLHLHETGHTPVEIASMFLLYEFFGVVTNFLGGWIGARFGLKSTLISGLLLQMGALGLLSVDPSRLTLALVLVAQGLSGIAKDLTKMSSKSYIKLVVPEDDRSGLMKWVALLTGSKNTLKGVGFFLGALLLATTGFRGACIWMLVLIGGALLTSLLALPTAPGRASSKVSLGHVFSRDARLNWLSAARLFLFGSRDLWFVMALPLFLSATLGWSFWKVGGFLALWIIGYGIVQAAAPRFTAGAGSDAPDASRLGRWTSLLLLPLAAIAIALSLGLPATATLVAGLAAFGFVFAANSAIHSYLVVAYAESDKVALRVGFYYTANALGRLVGTLLSGAVFQAWGGGTSGLIACLVGSGLFVAVSAALCAPLARAERA